MEIAIGIVIVLAVLLAGFLVMVALRPAEFQISRSATMNATPASVFPHVNDFHRWEAWSPWAKMDPHMKTTFEGPASGQGAKYSWVGNKKVGEGKMTVIQSEPPGLVRIKLEFLKPMRATNTANFTFQPESQGTKVTWTMSGTNGFMGKMFFLFMDMEKLIGPDFEKGLAALKAIVENSKKT